MFFSNVWLFTIIFSSLIVWLFESSSNDIEASLFSIESVLFSEISTSFEFIVWLLLLFSDEKRGILVIFKSSSFMISSVKLVSFLSESILVD